MIHFNDAWTIDMTDRKTYNYKPNCFSSVSQTVKLRQLTYVKYLYCNITINSVTCQLHIACHNCCRLSLVFSVGIDLAGQAVNVECRRTFAIHDFTYFLAWNSCKGGPIIEMNSNADKCRTAREFLSGLHIMFIILNPRSHAAVLIGRVAVANSSFLTDGRTIV